jgi:mannosyltransferase OCH1-like enzyme
MDKIIHQIWVGDFKIPNREKQLANNLKELHSDYEYMFWRDVEGLPDNVQYWYDRFYANKNYVFCADLLRIWVTYKYGGMYLDIDFDIQKKLDPLFQYDSVLFYHNDTDYTIPNNLIGATKGSPMLKWCLNNVNESCSWYGPSWFGNTIKNYLGLPYEIEQQPVMEALNKLNTNYHQYHAFELEYGKHLSLYSWEPKTWERLNKNEQL